MDYNEYAANMDVGQAYLEVMTKVVQDGFAFVSMELDQWGVAAAEAQRQHQQQQANSAGGAKGKGKANKGKSAGSAGNSNKDKGAANKESTAAPLQVTMAEKVRCATELCSQKATCRFCPYQSVLPYSHFLTSTFTLFSAEPPAGTICL